MAFQNVGQIQISSKTIPKGELTIIKNETVGFKNELVQNWLKNLLLMRNLQVLELEIIDTIKLFFIVSLPV